MKNKTIQLKHAMGFYAYLLVVWGFYRFLIQFPEPLDELLVKPIVWLIPAFILIKKEKLTLESIGLTSKNIFPAIYISLALGSVFAVQAMLVNFLKYDGLDFSANIGEMAFASALIISFVTASAEELAFRGYIFTRVWSGIGNQLTAAVITSIGWSFIHFPIAIFAWKLDATALAIYFFLTFIFSLGATFVFVKTKNIISPILLHVMWQWPIILFR